MLQCNVFPGLPPDFLDSEVNLFLMPFMDSEAESETPPRAGTVPPRGDLVRRETRPTWLEGDTGCPGLGVTGTRPGLRGDSSLSLRCSDPSFRGSTFPSHGRTGGPGPGLNSGAPGRPGCC